MSTELVPASKSGELEVDPVQYMTVVLNRAKEWLAEANSIDDVREAKAMAVGYESVIREKELAFDAQLAATEMVRRCECRIGELVRKGQREGVVRSHGQGGGPTNFVTADTKFSPREVFTAGTKERGASYAMADAPVDRFEQAITEARNEGNLSRANVVRKVKGDVEPVADAPVHTQQVRAKARDRVRDALNRIDGMCEGLTTTQIHAALSVVEPEELAAWREMATRSATALKRFRAHIDRSSK